MFLSVWKPDETFALVFEILLLVQCLTKDYGMNFADVMKL